MGIHCRDSSSPRTVCRKSAQISMHGHVHQIGSSKPAYLIAYRNHHYTLHMLHKPISYQGMELLLRIGEE